MDVTPPHLVSVYPDSGSTGLSETTELVFTFSEKMDRANAFSWLFFFPDQRIKKTSWKGATVAYVTLEEPLPADTLVVVEIAGSMRDAHKVQNQDSRRFPIATADSIAAGTIAGVLLFGEVPLKNGVVELYSLQPDSVEYFRRPIIRRTVTNNQGAFRFNWLPIPSGPFLVRAFQDEDKNLRPGENDPQRLLPDTLLVSSETGSASAGVTTLYASSTKGTLFGEPFEQPQFSGQVLAWAMSITDADTGYYPEPVPGDAGISFAFQDSNFHLTLENVDPGVNRVIAFVDVDQDSSFSVIPDTILPEMESSGVDSVLWYLEPWVMVENVNLEPGLSSRFALPAWGDSLTSWVKPEPQPEPVDSLSAALPDSIQELIEELNGENTENTENPENQERNE
ncbi:MAG: Ig-like domain-containing protein [bacterium]|nr:Ig-like domain-containing protein [bacterium]